MSASTQSVVCKNQCGYYGNPVWNDYCSKCYNTVYLRHQESQSRIQNISESAFSKFEEKRRQITGKGQLTVKNIFKFTKELLDEPKRKSSTSELPESHVMAKEKFFKYLTGLKSKTQAEVIKQVASIIDPSETFASIEQYSEALQKFYSLMNDKIENEAYIDSNEKAKLTKAIEVFITSWIYSWAFSCRNTDDEFEDSKLSEKIRSLDWVTREMLNVSIDISNPEEAKLVEDAIIALIQLGSVNNTLEKLDSIVNSCRAIFKTLKAHSVYLSTKANSNGSKFVPESSSANADEFLPALIWIVLKSNPPQLHSHLQYITRFTNQDRLSFGEHGYCFTNLSIAVDFIRKLNHESLKMTEKDFRRRMKGVHAPGKDATESQKILAENDGHLLDIEDAMTVTQNKMEKLEKDLINFDEDLTQKVNDIHIKYPLQLEVKLDPRHIENPQLLCFSPSPSKVTAASSLTEDQYQIDLVTFFK